MSSSKITRDNANVDYDMFHNESKIQNKIISSNNFTYFNIITILHKYIGKSKTVLDVGCGVGTIDFYIANKNIKVVGTDISERAINIAKNTATNLKLSKKVKFYCNKFPENYPIGKYDLVLCLETVEHVLKDKIAINILTKKVKNGGILLLSVPSINAPLFKMGLLNNFDKKVGHFRRYSKKSLIKLLKGTEMNLVEIVQTESLLRNMLFTYQIFGYFIKLFRFDLIKRIFNIIDNILVKTYGESQLILVAKKA